MFYPGFYFDTTIFNINTSSNYCILGTNQRYSGTYKKYRTVRTMNGYTGENVARMMLDAAGLYDVPSS